MSKSKFLEVLDNRNKQSKYKKMKMVRQATAFVLALGLGLGTVSNVVIQAKESKDSGETNKKDTGEQQPNEELGKPESIDEDGVMVVEGLEGDGDSKETLAEPGDDGDALDKILEQLVTDLTETPLEVKMTAKPADIEAKFREREQGYATVISENDLTLVTEVAGSSIAVMIKKGEEFLSTITSLDVVYKLDLENETFEDRPYYKLTDEELKERIYNQVTMMLGIDEDTTYTKEVKMEGTTVTVTITKDEVVKEFVFTKAINVSKYDITSIAFEGEETLTSAIMFDLIEANPEAKEMYALIKKDGYDIILVNNKVWLMENEEDMAFIFGDFNYPHLEEIEQPGEIPDFETVVIEVNNEYANGNLTPEQEGELLELVSKREEFINFSSQFEEGKKPYLIVNGAYGGSLEVSVHYNLPDGNAIKLGGFLIDGYLLWDFDDMNAKLNDITYRVGTGNSDEKVIEYLTRYFTDINSQIHLSKYRMVVDKYEDAEGNKTFTYALIDTITDKRIDWGFTPELNGEDPFFIDNEEPTPTPEQTPEPTPEPTPENTIVIDGVLDLELEDGELSELNVVAREKIAEKIKGNIELLDLIELYGAENLDLSNISVKDGLAKISVVVTEEGVSRTVGEIRLQVYKKVNTVELKKELDSKEYIFEKGTSEESIIAKLKETFNTTFPTVDATKYELLVKSDYFANKYSYNLIEKGTSANPSVVWTYEIKVELKDKVEEEPKPEEKPETTPDKIVVPTLSPSKNVVIEYDYETKDLNVGEKDLVQLSEMIMANEEVKKYISGLKSGLEVTLHSVKVSLSGKSVFTLKVTDKNNKDLEPVLLKDIELDVYLPLDLPKVKDEIGKLKVEIYKTDTDEANGNILIEALEKAYPKLNKTLYKVTTAINNDKDGYVFKLTHKVSGELLTEIKAPVTFKEFNLAEYTIKSVIEDLVKINVKEESNVLTLVKTKFSRDTTLLEKEGYETFTRYKEGSKTEVEYGIYIPKEGKLAVYDKVKDTETITLKDGKEYIVKVMKTVKVQLVKDDGTVADSTNEVKAPVTITQTTDKVTLKGESSTTKEGYKVSEYGLTTQALDILSTTTKEVLLTDDKSGMSVALDSKAFDVKKLREKLGDNVQLQVTLTAQSDTRFSFDVQAVGEKGKQEVSTFGSQVAVTFERVVKAKVASNMDGITAESVFQVVNGKLVDVPHQINDNLVIVRTFESGVFEVSKVSASFKDVFYHSNQDDILKLATKGITKGVGNGEFAPGRDITRAEFATMISRALGLKVTGESSFSDVKSGTWYTHGVLSLADAGIIQGVGNGQFNPSEKISREEVATILSRIIKAEIGSDVNMRVNTLNNGVSEYAKEAFQHLASLGISLGDYNSEYDYQQEITRGEMAKVLVLTLKKINLM